MGDVANVIAFLLLGPLFLMCLFLSGIKGDQWVTSV